MKYTYSIMPNNGSRDGVFYFFDTREEALAAAIAELDKYGIKYEINSWSGLPFPDDRGGSEALAVTNRVYNTPREKSIHKALRALNRTRELLDKLDCDSPAFDGIADRLQVMRDDENEKDNRVKTGETIMWDMCYD
jgi:hypothetical protein